ncbi:MAG: phage major capsid protein [Thermoplasmata archaeon]|nr:MAG: phage major capsid protein [Thermoplasmata archaeon]
MGASIDVKQFEEFSTSLKEALTLFKSQESQIVTLKQSIHDLEVSALQRSMDASYGQTATYGFTDGEQAKNFITFCKGIFTRDPAIKDMTEGTDSEGGYLVPEEWRPNLIQMLETYGVARRECTIIPMSREELVMPKLTSGVQVYWIGEGGTISETQPAFGELRMVAKKMAALVPMTSELLADTAIPIANLLLTLFAQALAKEEDRVAFTGDVSGASDPFDGVLNDSDVGTYTLGSGDTGFADLDADDLADVISSVTNNVADGAKFYMHRTVFNVIRKLHSLTYDGSSKSSDANYIFSAPQGSDPGTIWSYPYELVESMPDITQTAISTPFLIFGNMKHYYIADRQKLSIARSEHVGFAQDKVYLRAIQREAMAAAVPEAFTVVKTAAS